MTGLTHKPKIDCGLSGVSNFDQALSRLHTLRRFANTIANGLLTTETYSITPDGLANNPDLLSHTG